MNQNLILIFICYLFIACAQIGKSNEITKEAIDIYLSSELEEKVKIDSSLSLINKALELDPENIQALNHKTTLLLRKKDIHGLIKTADNLIKLNPDKPFYLGQKAIFFELKGDSVKAKSCYEKALEKYDQLLQNRDKNFDVMMEYVTFLEASGKIDLADKTLTQMEEMDFADYQKEMIILYRKQSLSKKQIFRYWRGEINFDQIGSY